MNPRSLQRKFKTCAARNDISDTARAVEVAMSGDNACLSNRCVIPAEVVAEQMARDRLGLDELMVRLLPMAARFARVPVSGFAVGAVAAGSAKTGSAANLYLGANLEIGRATLGATVHAEQAAVNSAWLNGETGIRSMAVSAAPCGHCRQFLHEISTAADLDVLIATDGSGSNGSYTKHSLAELLPTAFGPQQHGIVARLMPPDVHALNIESPDPLTRQAVAAAQASYAPYTENYAGVALSRADGCVVCGRTAENAAFNPSLSPLMSALSRWSLDTSEASFDIVAAVLVEVPTRISQRAMTAAILSLIAPDVRLRYVVAAIDGTQP